MILCCGEALIDMVPAEGGTFRPLAGGSVYNSAVALGRLGARTAFLWPISRDPFGEVLLRPLAEAGVDTSLCPRSDRPTTLAFVSLSNGDARYDFYDEGSAGRMFDTLPDTKAAEAILIGGISLVPEPCGGTVEALVEREGGRVPVYLDPNVRAFFIRDPEAHRARLARLVAGAQVVKLSGDDVTWMFPGLGVEQAAQACLEMGPAVVLTTSGGEGAAAHRRGAEPVRVPAERVTVADTIGAGDTFNAGFLAALQAMGVLTRAGVAGLGDAALAAALARGVRAAAVTVSRPGANPPWARELG